MQEQHVVSMIGQKIQRSSFLVALHLVHLILQIHDELVYEMREGKAEEISEKIKKITYFTVSVK